MADIVMRSQMLVTLRYQRVKEPPFKGQLRILGKVPKCYLLKIFKFNISCTTMCKMITSLTSSQSDLMIGQYYTLVFPQLIQSRNTYIVEMTFLKPL